MTPLTLLRAGPQTTVQDLGRPGHLAKGVSRGGAADRLAMLEGAALLGQGPDSAALEIAGPGARLRVSGTVRIALTGAPMSAKSGDRTLTWNASHLLRAGDVLDFGAATAGTYAYVSVGGGIDTPLELGSRSAHLTAGIGGRLSDGDELPVGTDPHPDTAPQKLLVADRFHGGTIRVVPGGQTSFYTEDMRARFADTEFTRDPRGNRQGVRLAFDGAPFASEGQKTILSEVIIPGDIQMTGDGAPFVLLTDTHTTGGYPRIGSILPDDLPIVAQAAPGAKLRFTFLSTEEARDAHRPDAEVLNEIKRHLQPLVRDPRDIADLIGYQLISGVTSGEQGDSKG